MAQKFDRKTRTETDIAEKLLTTPAVEVAPPATGEEPPIYRRELKPYDARLQLLVHQWTKDQLKQIASARGISVNDLVNKILIEYVQNN